MTNMGQSRGRQANGRFPKQGLYDPANEHDACGVGFVANIAGEKSHEVIDRGLDLLTNLEHRGACGCDPDSGDGAGLLIQIPDVFLRRELAKQGLELPEAGAYAVGMIFLAQDDAAAARQKEVLEGAVAEEGQRVLGWREVPIDSDAIGWQAREGLPRIEQLFIAPEGAAAADSQAFERKLFVIRRLAEKRVGEAHGNDHFFYVPSLSSRTVVYTGMLISRQIRDFYADTTDPDFASALCLVHSRYSTNTLGAWDLAHPFRYLAHNGEINTVQGNQYWMQAREGTMESELLGSDLQKLYPICREGASDSARFDNALEFLCLAGRELPEAILMMVPEAWENRDDMDADLRAYYEFNSFLLEPWDGPASLAFTDGRPQDRRRARPQRAAPVALHRHEGRLRHHGLRSGLCRHRARGRPDQAAPAPGQDLLRRPGTGPHHRRRGDQAQLCRAQALPRVGRAQSPGPRRSAPARSAGGEAQPRAALPAPAGLRLHQRGHQGPAGPHGEPGKVADWLDG
jgi:glutamate synthase domain-containing protein 1